MDKAQQILECLNNHIDILEKYGLTNDDLYSAHSAVVESIAKQNQLKLRQLEWRLNTKPKYRRKRGRKSQKKCRKNRLAKRQDLIVQARIDASYPNPHLDWRETHIRTKGYDIHDLNSYLFNDILQLED
jgi:hypothetical protein